ncbi:hypothetical protein LZA78_03900 [Sinirhodobacter sp. WL0062]|uniref:Uncharacterized protein n=1 Tax=Rhodobacter flavimaris TaxID=2907145 RepID=A0ABS8YVU0_9RHOB|nr:hypothetical protein [Sinirhodobacter sp. WL0062]MCE5972619.1 hypothetical protein [Sinirhodobacter sp. WL0062]
MFTFRPDDPSDDFVACFTAAGEHLASCLPPGFPYWLKRTVTPPFLEHLSFRLGNQLFFIRLEDVDRRLAMPGDRSLLDRISTGSQGHACLMPMRRGAAGWRPDLPGWGLVDAYTGLPVDPPALVSDALIEMTDWELHSMAVQVVQMQLAAECGVTSLTVQVDPKIDPSIWFEGSKGRSWIVLRASRDLEPFPARPSHILEMVRSPALRGTHGFFVGVRLSAVEQGSSAQASGAARPLWRGHALQAAWTGLQPAYLQ